MLFEFKHVIKRKPVKDRKSSVRGETILQDIHCTFRGDVPQLILGPSGSGKTTLLRLCNRLSDPNEGEILYRDKNINDWNVLKLRAQVGFVSQVPVMLEGTVYDNFIYAVRHINAQNIQSNEFDDECISLLRYLNLPENSLHVNAENLSVGEKQRVALARVLIRKPQVLLLDEPTSALDPTATFRFLDIIRKLQNEQNIAIIMVTHSIEQAMRVGGNALVLVDGRIVEHGEVEKIIHEPKSDITRRFVEGVLDN